MHTRPRTSHEDRGRVALRLDDGRGGERPPTRVAPPPAHTTQSASMARARAMSLLVMPPLSCVERVTAMRV